MGGDQKPGAKVVARVDQKDAIIKYFTDIGVPHENEFLTLDNMRPRHILVAGEFKSLVEGIIKTVSSNHRIAPKIICRVEVPLLENLTVAVGTLTNL